jgi:hypothetical protein
MTDNTNIEELLKAHLNATGQRFDKLEVKIDTLSDVVVSLARAETKLLALEESRHEQGGRLGEMERKSYGMKEDISDNTEFRLGAIKFLWITVSAGATILIGVYLKGIL